MCVSHGCQHRPLTRLRCVLSGGTAGRGLFEAVDGDGLVHDEESADHLPLVGPEQGYTVQDKQHNVKPQQLRGMQGAHGQTDGHVIHQHYRHFNQPLQSATPLFVCLFVWAPQQAKTSGLYSSPSHEANSLLCISIDQGVVGKHEASVGTEQQRVAHVGHRRRFGGPPAKTRQGCHYQSRLCSNNNRQTKEVQLAY